jgi:hypothetical protein
MFRRQRRNFGEMARLFGENLDYLRRANFKMYHLFFSNAFKEHQTPCLTRQGAKFEVI